MRAGFLGCLACAVAPLFALHSETTITGTVQLPKSAPPPPVASRYERQSVTPGRPEPATAVVYLEGDFTGVLATNRSAQLGQQHLQFRTGLLPVLKGTTVEFPNLDDGYHNVFSYSKPKRFDLGRYRKDEKPAAVTFDAAGVVKIYCEIHEHMRSTILVLNTPFFASTATNGHYRLEHLPAGKFVLKAWLNEKTILEKPVELQDGVPLQVDFPSR